VKVTSIHDAGQVEALIRAHQGAIRGYLVFLGCPADLVDDLVQDAFLSVLSSRFEHRTDPKTGAYLRKVARHLFLKQMERERRQLPLAELPLAELKRAEQAWCEFERDDGGRGYLAALKKCLGGVQGRPNEVLHLRYSQSLKLAMIADRLSLTESGVKSILVRTKRKLRDCIERRLAS
jgi:RNA polymerase sigma-70 factor (ECF subfamily)